MTGSRIIGWHHHQSEGEEISWIGECPWTSGLCFGTESGKLIIPRFADGKTAILGPISEEPINGAAFTSEFAGMTTRENVLFWNRHHRQFEGFDFGAHGIVATKAGGFIAPLGVSGVMIATIGPKGKLETTLATPPRSNINSYRACSLGELDDSEYFACASRRGGVVVSSFSSSEPDHPKVHAAGRFDFVDVCSLNSTRWPLAAACLGVDGTMFFSRNMLEDRLAMLQLADFPGKAYSLLRVNDHLVVLTSEALLVFPQLASRYLDERPMEEPIPVSFTPIRAAEIFSIRDEIYLVLEDGIHSTQIAQLIDIKGNTSEAGLPSLTAVSSSNGACARSAHLADLNLDAPSPTDWSFAAAPSSGRILTSQSFNQVGLDSLYST